ncbi:MAG TPA: hypothetical protein VEL75_02705, partial [Candidatus Methylomirabilis sp.]|nr:hypothetical protein [Candidatus Methylomirabilis sp.]
RNSRPLTTAAEQRVARRREFRIGASPLNELAFLGLGAGAHAPGGCGGSGLDSILRAIGVEIALRGCG